MNSRGSKEDHTHDDPHMPILEPLVHTTEHVVIPKLNPSNQTRMAAIIWTRILEHDLRQTTIIKELPLDPLKYITPANLAKIQKGIHFGVEPALGFYESFSHGKQAGATNTEATVGATAGAAATFFAANKLNTDISNHLPKATSTAGKIVRTFGVATTSCSIASAFLEVLPNYAELHQEYPADISALAATVGGITSFATGLLGIMVGGMGTAELFNPVTAPVGSQQIIGGALLLVNSGRWGNQTAHTVAKNLQMLPEYYDQALTAIKKIPALRESAKEFVREKYHQLKPTHGLTQDEKMALFGKMNDEMVSHLTSVQQTYKLSDAVLLPYGAALSSEVGNIFQIAQAGFEIHEPKKLDARRENDPMPKVTTATSEVKAEDFQQLGAELKAAAVTTPQMTEMNQKILPFVNELMQAWTDVSIAGFEKEKTVIALKDKLEKQKLKPNNTKEILNTTKQLKDEKARITCERHDFDQMLNKCGYTVNSAAAIAYLMGDGRTARDISVIGGSALQLGTLVAGLCGYGMLAAAPICPFFAASVVLGCAANISSLGAKDPSQQHAEQLTQLQGFVHKMYVEMHERFDEVMHGLDSVARQSFQQFFSLKAEQQAIYERLNLHDARSERDFVTLQGYAKTILDRMNELIDSTEENARKKEFLTIREVVNDKVALVTDSRNTVNNYDQARTKISGYVKTHGSGATNIDLIGKTIAINKPADLDSALNEVHPYFLLNTLLGVYDGLAFEHIFTPTLASMQAKLAKTLKDHYQVRDAISIGQLSQKELSTSSIIKDDSLINILIDVRKMNANAIIPVWINARWSMLVYQANTSTVYYYTLPNNESINKQVLDILGAAGFAAPEVHTLLARHVAPNESFVWMIEIANILARGQEVEQVVVEITTVQVNAEMKRSAQVDLEKLATTAKNPFVIQFLVLKMLEVVYTAHPQLGLGPEDMTPAELTALEELIRASDELYQIINLFSDPALFEKLANDYQSARDKLAAALTQDLHEFDVVVSKEVNLAASELSRTTHFSDDTTKALLDDPIDISSTYGHWYNNDTHITFKGEVRGNPCGMYGADTTYQNNQKKQIETVKSEYLKNRQTEFTKTTADSVIRVYNKTEAKFLTRPTMMKPKDEANKDLPILPPLETVMDYLPADIQQLVMLAHSYGVGRLEYSYQTSKRSSFLQSRKPREKLIINVDLVVKNKPICIGTLRTNYDPDIYTGKEALWWYWVGGVCANSLDGVMKQVYFFTAGNWGVNAKVPTLVPREGQLALIQKDKAKQLVENTFSYTSPTVVADMKFIATAIEEEQAVLEKRYAEEATKKLNTGSLKEVATDFNVKFKLLKLFVELVFPAALNDKESAIYRLLKSTDYIVDRNSALNHLATKPNRFIAVDLVSHAHIREFKEAVKAKLGLSNGLGRLEHVDVLQRHLLECLNATSINIKRLRTISERAIGYGLMSDVSDAVMEQLFGELSSNPTAQAQAAKLRFYIDAKKTLKNEFETNTNADIKTLMAPLQRLALPAESSKPAVMTADRSRLFTTPSSTSSSGGQVSPRRSQGYT